jgi:hypothetical protein
MTKEKFASLTKYANDTKNKLQDKNLPGKHLNRETSYRQFLSRELAMVNAKLEEAKAAGLTEKK